MGGSSRLLLIPVCRFLSRLHLTTMADAPPQFKPSCGNCCGLAGSNCNCQWSITGVLFGGFIILAAGVFTFFDTFIPIFTWWWYWDLCVFWFCLGVAIFACGWLHIIFCGCDKLKAQELFGIKYDEEIGHAEPPTPYIMITA